MQFRWYQRESIDSLYAYFQQATGNPLIALPTGTGKSVVIGGFAKEVLQGWPNQRLLMTTHVKELIEQNADKLLDLWPNAPLGIFSAGLKRREAEMPIVYAGIKSIIKNIKAIGPRNLMLIDECHLLSPNADTMYQQAIMELTALNPCMKVVGFTATKFRHGQGLLTNGGVFTDVAYDMTDIQGWSRLIADGFLCPLVPKHTRTGLDVSNVGINNGEFALGALQAAVDTSDINYKALVEACELGYDRHSWLAFCAGIEHSEHIAEMLNSFGISAAAVHSKLTDDERDKRIAAFKRGEIRCMTGNNVFTTGFDHPPVDLILMLRPTLSVVLWIQMLGRGTRPSPETEKRNCLVLDFARNTKRLGPVNDPRIPREKGKAVGDMPVKICPVCNCYNHARNRFCDNCGTEFDFALEIAKEASTAELLTDGVPQVEWFRVITTIYNLHVKEGSRPMIRVSYTCEGNQIFKEYIMLESNVKYVLHRAHEWWRNTHWMPPPNNTYQALQMLSSPEVRAPKRIRVHLNKKPKPDVIGHEF